MQIVKNNQTEVNMWRDEADVQRTSAMYLMNWLEKIAENTDIPMRAIVTDYNAILDGRKKTTSIEVEQPDDLDRSLSIPEFA